MTDYLEKATKQLEDFFECVGDEGLDRDGLHIAWQVYKEAKDKRVAELEKELFDALQTGNFYPAQPVKEVIQEAEQAAREKPDGYVAWHPEKKIGMFEIFTTSDRAMDALCMYEGYYEDDDFAPSHICPEEAVSGGWRIRPVRLVFLDEPTEGGE